MLKIAFPLFTFKLLFIPYIKKKKTTKNQIQQMMHENEQVPDIEKLELREFNLDLEDQKRVEAEAEEDVARVWGNILKLLVERRKMNE